MAREEERFECLSSSYPIMIINMNGKGAADERRKLIISIIKDSSASVIFCQEAIGYFKKKVVEECCNDDHSYKFVPEAVTSNKGQAVVMWCETDFQGEEVRLTDSSITKFVKRLWNEKYVLSVSEVRIRTALVKLTRKTTGASFLAVSWHGPRGGNKETKQKTLHGLICFLREVCEEEKLSSFIIGGDFNLNTSSPDQVDLTKYKGITISSYELCSRDKEQRGQSFVRYKDTFIVSVTVPPDEHSMTGDITVSLVTPRDFEKKANENALLDHVPVVGTLKLVLPDKRFSKQDRETFTEDEKTSEKDRPGLTPETTERTAEVGPHASGARKMLDFEGASSSSSGQSPSEIHGDYVTRKDFERLISLVDSLHEKIDQQTAEIAEIKLAIQRLAGRHRSVSQAQPTEPHTSCTT